MCNGNSNYLAIVESEKCIFWCNRRRITVERKSKKVHSTSEKEQELISAQ